MLHKNLLPLDKGLKVVLEHARLLDSERVPLSDAPGRVLAEDVRSDMDMPPFNKSAMDGYACRRADLSNKELRIIETIPAGRPPSRPVGPGECSNIMTGAAVPVGADCVVQVELTKKLSAATVRIVDANTRDNICLRGEDIRCGDVIMNRGTLLAPQHVGLLATVGCAQPRVARRPRVAVLSTGDEIVEPDAIPQQAQIRNSNGPQLCAQVRRAGGSAEYCGIIPDTETALNRAVQQATATCDLLIVSGGVSMGDFDLVPGILKANGFELLFEKLAVKPGMPTVFGVSEETLCVGLPGNPVSTFVIFELLVRPLLAAMMGHTYRPAVHPMRLAAPVQRRKAERDSWLPVETVGRDAVRIVDYHGSGHLGALASANGLICIPLGTHELSEDTFVDVRSI